MRFCRSLGLDSPTTAWGWNPQLRRANVHGLLETVYPCGTCGSKVMERSCSRALAALGLLLAIKYCFEDLLLNRFDKTGDLIAQHGF